MRRLLLPVVFVSVSVSLAGVSAAWEIPAGDIIFSHRNHVGERAIGCTLCHEGIEKSGSSSDKNLPTMDRCFACHNGQTAPVECELCHRSADEPKGLDNPKREVRFSHANHLKRNLDCRNCHRNIGETVVMGQAQFPDMGVCMECHFGKKKTADCMLCHTDTEMVRKNRHGEGWMHRHKFKGTQDPRECGLCHVNDETCEECHLGDNLQQLTHGLNFEFDHSLDARGKERDCTACHDQADFCAPCHKEREVMPEDHSGSFWVTDGHAAAAESDLEACVACHEEDDLICLKCHENGGGGDLETISPTPGREKNKLQR